MAGLTVAPLSLSQIRKKVKDFKELLGLRHDDYIDVLRILEFVLTTLIIEFTGIALEFKYSTSLSKLPLLSLLNSAN